MKFIDYEINNISMKRKVLLLIQIKRLQLSIKRRISTYKNCIVL
jgi:hypothetical protein